MKITKKLRKRFEEAARAICESFNPYIEESIKYHIDMKPMFLWREKAMTKEEIDADYIETAVKDMQYGYEHRMNGYYDKWYRYSHSDEGRAYDVGQRIASESEKCPEYCNYIEIAECNR